MRTRTWADLGFSTKVIQRFCMYRQCVIRSTPTSDLNATYIFKLH